MVSMTRKSVQSPDTRQVSMTPRVVHARSPITDSQVECSEAQERAQLMIESIRAHEEELWFQAENLAEVQTDLDRTNARLQQWFDNAPVGYLLLDRNGIV